MNLFTINGALLNGTRLAAVAATATLVCSASLSANAGRIQDALFLSPVQATVVAQATHIQSGVSVPIAGQANVYVASTHTQQAASSLTGSSDLRVFVIRKQIGEAYLSGSSSLIVIPASTLGNATIAASVGVISNATKIQPGRSVLDTAAHVNITAEPVVIRYVASHVLTGTGRIRVEPAINGVAWSYVDINCTGGLGIQTIGLVDRKAAATLTSTAQINSLATHIKPGTVTPTGTASVTMTVDPFILKGSLVEAVCSASATAQGTLRRMGVLALTGQASIQARATQFFGSSRATLIGSSVVSADDQMYRKVVAQITGGTAQISATALRTQIALSNLTGTGVVQPVARRTTYGQASFTGLAISLIATPTQTIRQGQALVSSTGLLATSPLVFRTGVASFTGNVLITSEADVFKMGAVNILGTVHVDADVLSNANSIDPPERTFTRPFVQTEFVRPFVEYEFRRAA